MAYFVTLDAANRITGLYTNEDGYAPPPPEAVAVTAEQGEQLRHGFASWKLVAGALVPYVAPPDYSALGLNNFKAMIRRRAAKLPALDAHFLLKTIGE